MNLIFHVRRETWIHLLLVNPSTISDRTLRAVRILLSNKRAWRGKQTRDNKFIKRLGDLNRGIFFDTPCMAFSDRERTGSTSFCAHRHAARTQPDRQTDIYTKNLRFPRREAKVAGERERRWISEHVESKNPSETRAEDSRCISS